MSFQPAYDIPLPYGATTILLRPSLQAAMRLEAMHSGFPALLTKIQQLDTTTLRQIISIAATDQNAAQMLLRQLANEPLQKIQNAVLGPALTLVPALMILNDEPGPAKANTKLKPWAELYADLFKMATGWLGWTPETAWNATLPEILHALDGYAEQLRFTHGVVDDEPNGLSEEQRASNEAAGLDPEFDRAGLHALKAKSKERVGQTI